MAKKEKVHKDRVQYVGTTRPKRRYTGMYVAVMVVCIYMGYLIGAAYSSGGLNGFHSSLLNLLHRPLSFQGGAYVFPGILVGILIAGFIILFHWSAPKNFARGYEQGEEEWADIVELNNRLSDPEPDKNRILTERLKMSTNPSITDLNNNMLVIGSPGSRKSHGLIRPNILNMNGSMVTTDPKGELLRTTANYLKKHGYQIKVLNLINMDRSDYYNPFDFISSIDDIPKLLTVFFANTTDAKAQKGDPFWEKAEMMFDQAIMTYLYMEKEHPTFPMVADLINKADVKTDPHGNPIKSELDKEFDRLKDTHPAKILYKKAMVGAADTIRSIVVTAQARLNIFSNGKLRKMMSSNSINFREMGLGAGDKKQKTAFFMVIPDVDRTYNAIAAMAYNQMIQELFLTADDQDDGRLPIPVTMWLDEFANISMPEDFLRYLATMRGRMISACMVIQGISQLKEMYKDQWETVPTCCDTLMFLGGNSLETNKWISEELGKTTYDKMTHGQSSGSHGSSSKNYDVYGRELITPAELRRMPRSKAIVIIAGEFAVYDDKYLTHLKPEYLEASKLGKYKHEIDTPANAKEQLSLKEKRKMQVGENILSGLEVEAQMLSKSNQDALKAYCEFKGIPVVHMPVPVFYDDLSQDDKALRDYFSEYNEGQLQVIKEALANGIEKQELREMLLPGYSVQKMKLILQAEIRRKNSTI